MRKSCPNLQRRLAAYSSCRRLRSFRDTAAAILNLEPYPLGVPGLLRWLVARENKGLNRGCEQAEGAALTALAWKAALKHKRVITEAAAVAEQQVPVSLSWEEKQQLLVQREAQRRAGDRQQVTLVPANRVDSPAPIPSGPSYCRKAKGECGQRLSKKLDRLLELVRTTDPADTDAGAEVLATAAAEPAMAESAPAELQPLAAPEAMAPQIGDRREPGPEPTTTVAAGDLADALVIAGSSAPEAPSAAAALQPLAESATADLHEQVLVAAAQAGLEQEPAEPLPVSIHAVEAAKELIPAAPT